MIRRADAHEVARRPLRQQRRRVRKHLVHELRRLADGEAADRVARQIHLHEPRGVPAAQILVHAALHDAEKPLLRRCHRALAPFRPALRALRRALRVLVVRGIRHALIERHDDIRAEAHLHLHRHLRRKELLRAVDMRAERHAFLRDLAQIAEAEHLEPAAVREDCTIPVHELVQAARLADELHTGPQEQMIRIRENDASTEILELIRRNALHRRLRADRHENRRLEAAVRRVDDSRTRARTLVLRDELISNCWSQETTSLSIKIHNIYDSTFRKERKGFPRRFTFRAYRARSSPSRTRTSARPAAS